MKPAALPLDSLRTIARTEEHHMGCARQERLDPRRASARRQRSGDHARAEGRARAKAASEAIAAKNDCSSPRPLQCVRTTSYNELVRQHEIDALQGAWETVAGESVASLCWERKLGIETEASADAVESCKARA
eukprot:3724969-Pleurochrysis_carterae.AAC.4